MTNSAVNQAPNAVVMIRPVKFGYNEQTAASNAFQKKDGIDQKDIIQLKALKEFDDFVAKLRDLKIDVIVVEDTPEPHKPDSIFPNNWFSMHNDGTVILYPMQAANRRLERRNDLVEQLNKKHQFLVKEVWDLSSHEQQDQYLEGTGSIVFDYINKIAYANISPRTHPILLKKVADRLGYKLISFKAHDDQGRDIYHTNVVMCVGDRFAVICAECIPGVEDRDKVLDTLEETGHELVIIDYEQMVQFAGNMLQLTNALGDKFLIISGAAHAALRQDQLTTLMRYAKIVPVSISTIEKYGGGSVRCMLAGVHLPRI